MPNLRSITYDGTDLIFVSSSGVSHTLPKASIVTFITDNGGWPDGKTLAEDECKKNLKSGIGPAELFDDQIEIDIADEDGNLNYCNVNAG